MVSGTAITTIEEERARWIKEQSDLRQKESALRQKESDLRRAKNAQIPRPGDEPGKLLFPKLHVALLLFVEYDCVLRVRATGPNRLHVIVVSSRVDGMVHCFKLSLL